MIFQIDDADGKTSEEIISINDSLNGKKKKIQEGKKNFVEKIKARNGEFSDEDKIFQTLVHQEGSKIILEVF